MERDGLRAEGEFLLLFGLMCVKNDWRIACWKLRWFPAVVLTKNHEGGEHDIMIHNAAQAELWSFRAVGYHF